MSTVLVTGANRGIGLEFVRQYALDGWRVHACCRQPAAAARDAYMDLKTRVQTRLIAELDPTIDVTQTEEVRSSIEELFDGERYRRIPHLFETQPANCKVEIGDLDSGPIVERRVRLHQQASDKHCIGAHDVAQAFGTATRVFQGLADVDDHVGERRQLNVFRVQVFGQLIEELSLLFCGHVVLLNSV